ncbi:MAG: group III truncated hemoglobin [Solirubrobacteraceae bacterium]
MRDIESREDCEQLVREFYVRALADPIIGWIFVDVARLDVEAHVPRIASFWETILLGAHSYRGGAFAPHAALNAQVPLRAGHFERWLWLWCGTVDELFAGERAELAKAHAQRVARAFSDRLASPEAASAGAGAGAAAAAGAGAQPSAPLHVQRAEPQRGVDLAVDAGDPAPRSAGEDQLLAWL